jgi:hypothetical protein
MIKLHHTSLLEAKKLADAESTRMREEGARVDVGGGVAT